MRFEKRLFKMSFQDISAYFLMVFIPVNFIALLYTIIDGNIRILISGSSWIIQILYPLGYAIINAAYNRIGLLQITDFSDYEVLKDKLESLMLKRSLIRTLKDSGLVNFTKKSRLGRFLFSILREDIDVKYSADEIVIFGKRNSLATIETKLRFDKELNHG